MVDENKLQTSPDEGNLDEEIMLQTQPGEDSATTETEARGKKKARKKRSRWVWAGILFFLVCVIVGGLLGYRQGINRRLNLAKTTVVEVASEQFQLAYQDLASGNYDNAKTRIEYVIRIYPSFPGSAELLRTILMQVQQPTIAPTSAFNFTPTPEIAATPDTRGAEQTFSAIQQAVANQQWDAAVEDVISIKQNNYDYRTVEVDGLYYIALRNRGMARLSSGQLEQGLFDLATAEQMGPIDKDADGIRTWASLYLTGASYWDVNWQQAIEVFYQVQSAYPYMMDSSGVTALDRYRIALYRFGDQFATQGNYCKAYEYYNLALGVAGDPVIQATASSLQERCQNMEKTPEGGYDDTPVPEETPTPVPTEIVETETPTP